MAAFHVFMYHAWAARGLPRPIRAIEDSGHVAVTFFFVLSGFILAATYGKRGRFSVKDFAVARFARVYPLYALCLVVAALLSWYVTGHGPDLASAIVWVESFLLVQNWLPPSSHALWGVAWTLSVEAFFYATFPFLLRWTAGWRSSTLRSVLAAVVVAYAALRWIDLPISSIAIFRLPEFFMGVLVGRLYLQGVLKGEERRATALFYTAFALTLLVPQLFPLKSTSFGGLMAPLFAAMILSLANTDALPARLLRSRSFMFLGGASYALYLFHGFAIFGTDFAFGRLHRTRADSGVLFAAIASVSAVSMACLLFVCVEEPARGWLRKRLMTPRPTKTELESAALQSEPL